MGSVDWRYSRIGLVYCITQQGDVYMKYVATGTRKTKDSFTQVIIPLTEETRVGAVNQAERIAKRDKVTVTAVLPLRNSEGRGEVLTKAAKQRKKDRAGKRGA